MPTPLVYSKYRNKYAKTLPRLDEDMFRVPKKNVHQWMNEQPQEIRVLAANPTNFDPIYKQMGRHISQLLQFLNEVIRPFNENLYIWLYDGSIGVSYVLAWLTYYYPTSNDDYAFAMSQMR